MKQEVMKSALITGASSGFGQETAVELLRLGWRVIATMRDTGKAGPLQETVRALSAADRLHVVAMDVTKADSIDRAVSQSLEITGGTLDVLFNNAGFTSMGFFEDMTDADCRSVMETNFFGAVAVTRAIVPLMRGAGHGRIGFVSSNAVLSPHPTMSMYAASKWAIEGFAEALAMELAPFGVDVVVLQPGNHRTPFGSHVNPIKPDDSPYAHIWDAAMPGLARLSSIGADSSTAIPTFIQALTEAQPAFHRGIGNDVALFTWLKRNLPYEARAAFVRDFMGIPGRALPAPDGKEIKLNELLSSAVQGFMKR